MLFAVSPPRAITEEKAELPPLFPATPTEEVPAPPAPTVITTEVLGATEKLLLETTSPPPPP